MTERIVNHGSIVCAASRSSGKSIVSIGIAAAAQRAGMPIRCFKKGPDFIDPLWLAEASDRRCFNLDPILQSPSEVAQTYLRWRSASGFNLVEGSMGLHDGLADDFSDSNAALSKHIGLPVLLVVDASGMNRTIAAVVNGLKEFDPDVRMRGVVLNRVRSSRHEQKLCSAIHTHSDLHVLGVVPESSELQIDERELGLVPAPGTDAAGQIVDRIANVITNSCDLGEIFGDASSVRPDNRQSDPVQTSVGTAKRWRVAVAMDAAFQFYYQDDLAELESRGVEVVKVSPLDDPFPENVDGLLLGGGFPERFASSLSENTAFLSGLREAARSGLAIRAECAGLMMLCRSIQVGNNAYNMAGVIDGDIHMKSRPVGRGYMCVQPTADLILDPAPNDSNAGVSVEDLNAHEFHHSALTLDPAHSHDFAYRVRRGHGIDGDVDGVRVHNVIASYAHFRHCEKTPWVDSFVNQLKQTKNSTRGANDQSRYQHV